MTMPIIHHDHETMGYPSRILWAYAMRLDAIHQVDAVEATRMQDGWMVKETKKRVMTIDSEDNPVKNIQSQMMGKK